MDSHESSAAAGAVSDGQVTDAQQTVVRPLSVLDQTVSRKYVCRMFMFPLRERGKYEQTIRDKLEEAVNSAMYDYPFLKGVVRPCDPPTGQANAIEVAYVEAEERAAGPEGFIGFAVKDASDDGGNPSYGELSVAGMPPAHLAAFCPPVMGVSSATPRVFQMWVTFITGGVVLAFAFQHSVVDGHSIFLFLKDFSTQMTSPDECIVPDQMGPEAAGQYVDPLDFAAFDEKRVLDDYDFRRRKLIPGPEGNACTRILVFSAHTVNQLKVAITEYALAHIDTFNVKWVSDIDCIGALAWISIMRARAGRLDGPRVMTKYASTVNMRGKLDPPLPDHYFGNMFSMAVGFEALDALNGDAKYQYLEYLDVSAEYLEALKDDPKYLKYLNADGDNDDETLDLAKLPSVEDFALAAIQIRRSIRIVDNEYLCHRLAIFAQLDDIQAAHTASARAKDIANTGVTCGSLVNFGADLDFGIPGTTPDGKPEFSRKFGGAPGVINVLPRRGGTHGTEDWELHVTLLEDEMEAVCEDLTRGGWVKRIVA